jgi:UDP-glucose 4-epimerase
MVHVRPASPADGLGEPASVDLKRDYAGQNVLIAGADGFLGVNCAIALHRAGARVTLLSRSKAPRAAAFSTRRIQADLRDGAAVAAAVEGQNFVFDLAGSSGAVGSNRDPATNADEECRPHLTLFAAAAKTASRPVLAFCSSRLVYGRPERLPVDEEHPVRPASFYAVHKLTLEHYLRILGATQGLRFCIFRLSNPYGPHWPQQQKTYGLINQFIAHALTKQPIDIFGDGLQKRDYIQVEDFISAMLAASSREFCLGETFNVGGRESISIRDAVTIITEEIPGTQVRYRPWPTEYRAVETGDYQTDLTKLNRFVHLPPQMAFRQGLRQTLQSVKRGLPSAKVQQ